MSTGIPDFLRFHRLALFVFVVVATVFLWDVLLLDYSLGAFDIILNQPSWKGEFPISGVHQPILSDSPAAHYPQREFDWGHVQHLKNGEFNPYMFTGMPWIPQGIGAFVTSLPQLFLDIRNAIDWSTWFRLVCAGFFMYLLMLELGLSRASGIFAGILWTYSLHQIVWLEFPQHLATQLWIPLLFLFNLRIMNRGVEVPTAIALVVVNVLFFTSGYTQIVLYTYIAVGLFNTVYVAVRAGDPGFGIGARRWLTVHALYVAAVAVCAVGVFAEMKFISEGLRGAQDWRGHVDAPELTIGAISRLLNSFLPKLSELTHVLNPHYYGGIWDGRYQYPNGNVVETARYFGVLGVLFAISALFVPWGTRYARAAAAFIIVTGITFSLFYRNEFTMGLFRLIPFADKGNYSRFITLLTFFGCVLSGYGFHLALGRGYKWLFVSMTVVLAAVVIAWTTEDGFRMGAMWYPCLVIAGLAAAVVVRNVLKWNWTVIAGLVIAVTIVDLAGSAYGFNTRMANERLFPTNNTIRFLLNDPEPYRVAVVSERPLYHPNILSFYDIPVVEGYSTVLPLEYARYVERLFPKEHITRNGILFLFEPNVEALRLLNVKYVLSDEPLASRYPGLEHVLESNNHAVYRVKNHLPRLFCATDVVLVEKGGNALKVYADVIGDFDRPLVVPEQDARDTGSGNCEVQGLKVYTHRVTASVTTDAPRYLGVPYPYSDNWHAEVNGEPGEIVKANGYHMALHVPPGASDIEIYYQNPLSRAAAWIFILAAAGVLVYARRSSSNRVVLRTALAAVSVIVIFKSSLSLPLIRNDYVPERVPPAEPYRILAQGERRIDRELHSDRILQGNPVEYPLKVDSAGLTRISLLAGTFHQPRLEHDVKVQILDAAGEVLSEKVVEGPDIFNNSWFTVDFPAIEKDVELRVRVSSRVPDRSGSFILWLNDNGDICVQTWYEWKPADA